MHETLLRPQEVSATPALPSIQTAVAALKNAEIVAEERRLKQKATTRVHKESAKSRKRKREGPDASTSLNEGDVDLETEKNDSAVALGANGSNDSVVPIPGSPVKKRRSELGPIPTPSNGYQVVPNMTENPTPDPEAGPPPHHPPPKFEPSPSPVPGSASAKPFAEVRGHTSYLTFAVLLPYEHVVASGYAEPRPPVTEPDAGSSVGTPEVQASASV